MTAAKASTRGPPRPVSPSPAVYLVVGRRWPRQRIAASRHSGLGCMSPAEGVHDHAGVVLQCCLRFDGGILPSLAACARIQRTRIECIGQETRRPFRLLFVATQSLHILRNMVHRVAKAAENMLRCRLIGTSPILLPQKRGVAPQKQRALRIWGRRRTLQQRGEQRKKTFGGALPATTPRPRSALECHHSQRVCILDDDLYPSICWRASLHINLKRLSHEGDVL